MSFVSKEKEPTRSLGKYGELEFRRITRYLGETKILADIDLSLLESACRAYHVHCQLEYEMPNTEDRFETTDKGNLILSPKSIESKRQLEIYTKVVLQYGVTPLARMRISTPEKSSDEMEDFTRKYGG